RSRSWAAVSRSRRTTSCCASSPSWPPTSPGAATAGTASAGTARSITARRTGRSWPRSPAASRAWRGCGSRSSPPRSATTSRKPWPPRTEKGPGPALDVGLEAARHLAQGRAEAVARHLQAAHREARGFWIVQRLLGARDQLPAGLDEDVVGLARRLQPLQAVVDVADDLLDLGGQLLHDGGGGAGLLGRQGLDVGRGRGRRPGGGGGRQRGPLHPQLEERAREEEREHRVRLLELLLH